MASVGTSAAALVAAVAVLAPSGTPDASGATTAVGATDGAAARTAAGTAAQTGGGKSIDILTAAYEIKSDVQSSVVTVTLRSAMDPDKLRSDLAAAGVNADVLVSPAGSKGIAPLCGPDVIPVPKNDDQWAADGIHNLVGSELKPGEEAGFAVTPSKLPKGSTLSLQIYIADGRLELMGLGLYTATPEPCAVPPVKSGLPGA